MRRLARPDLQRPGVGRALLLALAGAALTVAAAEPRWVEEEAPEPEPPPIKRVVLAIDVSASMQAEDAQPTRLGQAAAAARQVLDTLAGHEVGLVLFAGKAYPMAPPTLDHQALLFLLGGVTPRVASAQDPGTLLSVAIQESVALLRRRFTSAEGALGGAEAPGNRPSSGARAAAETVRAVGVARDAGAGAAGSPERTGEEIVVLFTDGDAGEREADVRAAVAAAREAGVAVYAVAVGTSAGAGMVMPSGTYQLGGRVLDARGRPAASRLREALLREVAELGGGRYAHAAVPSELAALRSALADLGVEPPEPEPVAGAAVPAWARRDLPFFFGAAALALIALESLLGMTLPRFRIPAAERAARARAAS